MGGRLKPVTIRKKVSELMPELFDVDPPSIHGADPLILVGSLIKANQVSLLPSGKAIPTPKRESDGIRLYPAFGGYGVLKKIVDSAPAEYYQTLWAKASEFPVWIGSCRYSDSFDDVLRAYSATKFGGARITKGVNETIVSLVDVVRLIDSGKLSTHMSTDDVSSVPISTSGKSPILEAIKTMIGNRVRRLFIDEAHGQFISDRTLIDYMFSPRRLEVARDHPEEWIDQEVSKTPTKMAVSCRTGSLDEASRSMGPAPDDCLMTDEGNMISNWDMVMKPWLAGRLAVVEN